MGSWLAGLLPSVLGFFSRIIGAWLSRKSALVVESELKGAADQAAKDAEARADAEARVAQAEADAPNSVQEVDKRLEDGTF